MDRQFDKPVINNTGENSSQGAGNNPEERPDKPGDFLQAKKILLVEDSEVSRCLLQEILEIKGYSVMAAEDGVQAIEFLNSHHFDIVLMDLELPRLDGFGVAAFLNERVETKLPKPRIIALTGRSRESDRQVCKEKGIDMIINKADGHGKVIDIIEGKSEDLISDEEGSEPETETDENLDPNHFLSSVNNDMQIFKTVAQVFLKNYPIWLSEATDAIFQRDNIKMAQLAHKLKGTIAHFEIGPIYRAAEKLETAANDGDWETSKRLFARIQIGMENMERRMIQYMGDDDADSCDR